MLLSCLRLLILHLMYPNRFAPLSPRATMTKASHCSFSPKTVLKSMKNHKIGNNINPIQNILDSAASTGCFFRASGFLDSYIHWLLPSSSILFHHRRPTSSLPVYDMKRDVNVMDLSKGLGIGLLSSTVTWLVSVFSYLLYFSLSRNQHTIKAV